MAFTLETGSLSSTEDFQMFKLCPDATLTLGDGVNETIITFSETTIIAVSCEISVCQKF
jgi:hypothetical protein